MTPTGSYRTKDVGARKRGREMDKTLDILPGEGEVETITRERIRVCCDECGEPAHYKHCYLLPNARTNPASSGYGGDDISWCSDTDAYTCKTCKRPVIEGYEQAATFSACVRFAHMFLEWRKKQN